MLVSRSNISTHAAGSPAAILLELSPLPAAAEAVLQDVAPGPLLLETQPKPLTARPDSATPEAVDENTPLRRSPLLSDYAPETPSLSQESPLPEQAWVAPAEAVLPPSRPRQPPRPAPRRPLQKPAVRKPSVNLDSPQQDLSSAPPPSQARGEQPATSPIPGALSAVAQASWRSSLLAHLNRHKRFPAGASGGGTATVAFTISQTGQVLSARLMRSSGDPVLDLEAVALVKRANPVPPPPPEAARNAPSLTLTVPVRYNR
nr:TonB family protein [Microvirga antarctica]